MTLPKLLGEENLERLKNQKDELDLIRQQINDQEKNKALI